MKKNNKWLVFPSLVVVGCFAVSTQAALVAHWDFNSVQTTSADRSGPEYLDVSGNGHHADEQGTMYNFNGTYVPTPGKNASMQSTANPVSAAHVGYYDFRQDEVDYETGGGASLINDRLDISSLDGFILAANAGLTLAAWVNPGDGADGWTTGIADYTYLIGFGEVGDNPIMTMQIDADGKLNGWVKGVGSSDGQVEVTSTTTIPADTWTHVAITYDRANDLASLYVNGALDSTFDISTVGDGELAFGSAHLGGREAGSDIFLGGLDDLMVYNDVRSAAQIAALASFSATAPVINFFTVSPREFLDDQPVTLRWSVAFVDSVRIDHGIGTVPSTGRTNLYPAATTTWTLTAAQAVTNKISAQATATQLEKAIPFDRILVDFGLPIEAIPSPHHSGNYWNNIRSPMEQMLDSVVNSDGSVPTGVRLHITDALGSISSRSMGHETIYGTSATGDFFYLTRGGDEQGRLTITGLDPSGATVYDLKFFASSQRPLPQKLITDYTVAGASSSTTSLEAVGNVYTVASVDGMIPNAFGEIEVTVSINPDSDTYAAISVMEVRGRAPDAAVTPDPEPYVSELIDPRFPSERVAPRVEERARWLPTRIRLLEAERNQLLEAISILPQHHPIVLSSHLGYHSRVEETGAADALPPCQIDFTWPWHPLLDSIAFVPAFNSKDPGSYAFPKRFKIEVLPLGTNEFETVVNWMDEDFPDPGLYPVFFSRINRHVKQVRITLLPVLHESGMAYTALGEVYLLQQRPDGSTGPNMAAWGSGHVEVEASDSFSMPPLWDIEYLTDGLMGLGFPLSDEMVAPKDLMIRFEDENSADEVQLLLDLGHVKEVGRVDFWPAAPLVGLAIPSLGFPGEISVELSPYPDFKVKKVVAVDAGERGFPREKLLSFPTQLYQARYLRVTIRGLSQHKGKRILGLGEISVSGYEEVLSVNCRVTAQGIPGEYMDQLPRLVDGCSRQRRILSQGEWIKGLAQRRPLDQRLAVVERELEQAQATWRENRQRFGMWGAGILLMGAVGGLVMQQQMRKRGIKKLKQRIAQDLHDDVGSNLGSISLASERLERVAVDADMKEDLNDLSLLAREACASLREVVWVIAERTIRLPALIQKLVERAERVLVGVNVFVETSEDCPNCMVSLIFKRHLVMLFKEVVHNCARHAHATKVWVSLKTDNQTFQLSFRDNGCGFNPTEVARGLGLEGMEERAMEMGGRLELNSRSGEGTEVILTIPLTALLNKTDRLYKTSN